MEKYDFSLCDTVRQNIQGGCTFMSSNSYSSENSTVYYKINNCKSYANYEPMICDHNIIILMTVMLTAGIASEDLWDDFDIFQTYIDHIGESDPESIVLRTIYISETIVSLIAAAYLYRSSEYAVQLYTGFHCKTNINDADLMQLTGTEFYDILTENGTNEYFTVALMSLTEQYTDGHDGLFEFYRRYNKTDDVTDNELLPVIIACIKEKHPQFSYNDIWGQYGRDLVRRTEVICAMTKNQSRFNSFGDWLRAFSVLNTYNDNIDNRPISFFKYRFGRLYYKMTKAALDYISEDFVFSPCIMLFTDNTDAFVEAGKTYNEKFGHKAPLDITSLYEMYDISDKTAIPCLKQLTEYFSPDMIQYLTAENKISTITSKLIKNLIRCGFINCENCGDVAAHLIKLYNQTTDRKKASALLNALKTIRVLSAKTHKKEDKNE